MSVCVCLCAHIFGYKYVEQCTYNCVLLCSAMNFKWEINDFFGLLNRATFLITHSPKNEAYFLVNGEKIRTPISLSCFFFCSKFPCEMFSWLLIFKWTSSLLQMERNKIRPYTQLQYISNTRVRVNTHKIQIQIKMI